VLVLYIYIWVFVFPVKHNKNKYQITHSHSLCISEFIWLYSITTCFGSWSHHQVIHKQVLHYWIVFSMWIHILCFLSCVTNNVIIQRASLTFAIHHYMHKLLLLFVIVAFPYDLYIKKRKQKHILNGHIINVLITSQTTLNSFSKFGMLFTPDLIFAFYPIDIYAPGTGILLYLSVLNRSLFFPVSLQPNFGPWPPPWNFRFISVTRSRTVGWTPWTSDQFVAT
jgi:hypothetical protein